MPATPAPLTTNADEAVATGPGGSVATSTDGGVRLVRVVGRLDSGTAAQLAVALDDPHPEEDVVLDLTAMTGTDATATGVVLAAAARSRRRGQPLAVASSSAATHEALLATGLGSVVPVVHTVADALAALGLPPVAAAAASAPAATTSAATTSRPRGVHQ